MGIGECAGEVVSQAEFTLAASERELFEAQLLLGRRPPARSGESGLCFDGARRARVGQGPKPEHFRR